MRGMTLSPPRHPQSKFGSPILLLDAVLVGALATAMGRMSPWPLYNGMRRDDCMEHTRRMNSHDSKAVAT
eukprot:3465161-Amphidinium_carterae.1